MEKMYTLLFVNFIDDVEITYLIVELTLMELLGDYFSLPNDSGRLNEHVGLIISK